MREIPYASSDVVIVLDNHSSHKSRTVREWASQAGLTLKFLPSYSSVLSCVERIWALFKRTWARYLSKLQVTYNRDNLDKDINLILAGIRRRLTHNIMHSA